MIWTTTHGKKKTFGLNSQRLSSNWGGYWLSTKRKGGVVQPNESRESIFS